MSGESFGECIDLAWIGRVDFYRYNNSCYFWVEKILTSYRDLLRTFWGHLSVPTKRLLLWVFLCLKGMGMRYLYPTKNCWVPDLLCSVGALFRMTWRIDWFGPVTNQLQCHIPTGNLASKKHNFLGASCEFYGLVVFCFRLRQADVWQKSKAHRPTCQMMMNGQQIMKIMGVLCWVYQQPVQEYTLFPTIDFQEPNFPLGRK